MSRPAMEPMPLDVRAREDGQQRDGADEARRRRQREQVVARKERLQEDVVEREGERRAEDDQRPFQPGEGKLLAGAEADHDDDPGERDGEAGRDAQAEAFDPEGDRECHREGGGESDDQRRHAGGGGLLADVQRKVVARDDDDARDEESRRIAAVKAGEAVGAPEEEGEPGRGDEVPRESDLLGADSVVDQRLDDREGRGPDDDRGGEGRLRNALHASL